MWIRIFLLCSHSIHKTCFLFVKKIVLEKSKPPLILFYFKVKIKQEIKP